MALQGPYGTYKALKDPIGPSGAYKALKGPAEALKAPIRFAFWSRSNNIFNLWNPVQILQF